MTVKLCLGVCMQRAGHEDKIKGVPGFESWGFRDNQHDKWNVCRPGSILACLKRPFRPCPQCTPH